MTDRSAQIAAIKQLREYDHVFISPEGVAHFTAPFGFKGTMVRLKANPNDPKGLTLENGAEEAEGADAASLAAEICRHLGVECPAMLGRGSQLRVCCDVLLEHLEKN